MKNRYFDNELFSEQDQAPGDRSGVHAEKFLALHFERIESVKALIGNLPREGEILFLWTLNSFNAFTFIPFLIKECGTIDELIISTYSINIRIIDALMKLIDRGKIHRCDLFISDSIRSRLPRVFEHLSALVESRQDVIRVHYSWNHSKIALIRCGDQYFDVEGSGNWGENAQHEQYIFLSSQTVFHFRKNEIIHATDPGTT